MDLKTGEMKKLWSAEATSVLKEEGKPGDFLGAGKAIDGDISTAWAEGADGAGIGESLTIDFGREREIYYVSMIPGFAKSREIYYGNNRVKNARFEMADGSVFGHEFDDHARLHEIEFIDETDYPEPDGIVTSWIKITILDVYLGDRWDDTCISEFSLVYGWHKPE